MKIVAPLSKVDDYELYLESGADEFFCGFVPYEWLKTYGMATPVNRRGYLNTSNICVFSAMKILGEKVAKYGAPVKVAFNSLSYDEKQYAMIMGIIRRLRDYGFNSLIIADLGLLVYLREHGLDCQIHMSGETPVINSETIDFFRQFDVQRFIFPRKTAIAEMEACIKKNSTARLEYETFILNENCLYTGAFCNTLHCDEMVSACFIPARVGRVNDKASEINSLYRLFRLVELQSDKDGRPSGKDGEYRPGQHGCGLCHLKELEAIGITHLKIVGRGKDGVKIARDIATIRRLIVLAGSVDDHGCFREQVRKMYFPAQCPDIHRFCYYPQA